MIQMMNMNRNLMILKVIIAITVQATLSDDVHEQRIHDYQTNHINHSSDNLSWRASPEEFRA